MTTTKTHEHTITVELELPESMVDYFQRLAKVCDSTVEDIMVARLKFIMDTTGDTND